jgi:hypothetical protein
MYGTVKVEVDSEALAELAKLSIGGGVTLHLQLPQIPDKTKIIPIGANRIRQLVRDPHHSMPQPTKMS